MVENDRKTLFYSELFQMSFKFLKSTLFQTLFRNIYDFKERTLFEYLMTLHIRQLFSQKTYLSVISATICITETVG